MKHPDMACAPADKEMSDYFLLQGHVQAASEPHNIKLLGDSPAHTVSEAQAEGLRPNNMPVGLLDAPPAVGCPVLAARGLGARAGLRRSPGGSQTCN